MIVIWQVSDVGKSTNHPIALDLLIGQAGVCVLKNAYELFNLNLRAPKISTLYKNLLVCG